ncbi:MAG: hypothetical protein JKY41_12255 [Rhodobacteraceae bacterium]|nr:hypothetical protein [Paracoccaceae bacterium]
MIKYISLFALAVGVSACATTTPLAPGDPATISQADADAAKAEIVDLMTSFIAGDTILTPDTPISGTAQYNGNLVLSDGVDSSYAAIGDLVLDANFDAGTIVGTASNFNSLDLVHGPAFDPNNFGAADILAFYDQTVIAVVDAIIGELAIDGDITGNQILATLTGELTGLGLNDAEISAIIDATIYGAFLTADGSGADMVYGDILGTADIDGTPTGIGGALLAN